MNRNSVGIWIDGAAILTLALAVRVFNLDHQPLNDELFHLLAARSWESDGTFSIGDGVYNRAWLFTALLGTWMSWFGNDLTSARLLIVCIGSLWVLALFLWVRFSAGRMAAWVAALLLCLAPGAIFLSQFIRFYALHGLVFLFGAALVYCLLIRRYSLSRVIALAVLAILCFSLAFHLQLTTLIGLAGLAFAVVAVLSLRWEAIKKHRKAIKILAGLLVLLVIATLIVLSSGLAEQLLEKYQHRTLWVGSGGGFKLYHWMLVKQYAVFWSLLPLLMLFAAYRRSVAALFCVTLFVAAIILHSFGGIKGERYIYYAMPFFFAFIGIVVADLIPYLMRFIRQCIATLFQAPRLYPWKKAVEWSCFGLIVLFLVGSNGALKSTSKMLRGKQSYASTDPREYWVRYVDVDWAAAQDTLLSLIHDDTVVVTTKGPHALYYLGRYDFEINKSHLHDFRNPHEFRIDDRTGRPAVSLARSIRLILSCYPSGVLIADVETWRKPVYLNNKVADVIANNTERVNLPAKWGMRVFTWQHQPDGDDCQSARNL